MGRGGRGLRATGGGAEEDFDGRPCSMWSACRDVWAAWAEVLDRPPFFYPGGREVSCYDGRDFDEVVGEYRAWIAAERDRLRAADADAHD